MNKILRMVVLLGLILLMGKNASAAVISEVCASNGTTYVAEDGSTPDWIELHNDTGTDEVLDGWYLSDDEDYPQLADLSGVTIPAGGYTVLAADKEELPFKLSSSGCELYLTSPDGKVQHVTVPKLAKDASYSLQADGTWQVTEGAYKTKYGDIQVCAFGDSIMYGAGNNGIGPMDLLAETYGFTLKKWAKSGATVSWQDWAAESEDESNHLYNIQYQIEASIKEGDTPDLVVMNGRTNDLSWKELEDGSWGLAVELGELTAEDDFTGNYDRTTFIGALETIFYTFRTTWPDAKVIYVIDFNMQSKHEEFILQFTNAIIETALKWSVDTVDLYHEEFNTAEEQYLCYTNPTEEKPEGDATHPTEEGYRLFYIPLLEEKLVALMDASGKTTESHSTTPGMENHEGSVYVPEIYVKAPEMSAESGYYEESFDLTMKASKGCKIYYTTDTTTPTTESTRYTGSIHLGDASLRENVFSALDFTSIYYSDITASVIPKCHIIKAIAVDADGNVSTCITKSYFVGMQYHEGTEGIHTISIVADPDELFGEENGIYRTGDAFINYYGETITTGIELPDGMEINYLKTGIEYERKANVEYFSENGELLFSQTLGLKIHGNYSRHQLQKSFLLKARNEYGDSKIDYCLFDDSQKVSSVVLRNEKYVPYDIMNHRLVYGAGLLTSRDVPCVVFLNGEYWGIYHLREAQNEEYIADRYGVTKDEILMCKNDERDGAEEYLNMLQMLSSLDMSLDVNYKIAEETIDVQNYARYIALSIFANNVDGISFNYTAWRSKEHLNDAELDGRWRWICQDTDDTLGKAGLAYSTTVWQRLEKEQLFLTLISNSEFKKIFLEELTNLMNTSYSDGRVQKILGEVSGLYTQYVSLWGIRYCSTDNDVSSAVDTIITWIHRQHENIFENITENLDVRTKYYSIDIESDESLPLSFSVNGHEIPLISGGYNSIWYKDQHVSFSIQQIPGYRFEGWYQGNKLLSEEYTLDITVLRAMDIKLVFTSYDTIFSINSKRTCSVSDGTVTPTVSSWKINANITCDYDLSMTEDGMLTAVASGKWKKKTGLLFTFDTAGYSETSLAFTCIPDKESPERWKVQCSIDGEEWLDICELKCESEQTFLVNIPSQLDDLRDVRVRIIADKKGGPCTVTLSNIYLYGKSIGYSVAKLRDLTNRYAEDVGEPSAIDPDDYIGASEWVIQSAEREVEQQRLQKLLLSTVDDAGEVVSGYSGVAFEIRGEWGISSGMVSVPVSEILSADVVELYRINGTTPEFMDEYSVGSDGTISVPNEPGIYILCDHSCDVQSSEAVIEKTLDGFDLKSTQYGDFKPSWYYRLTVTGNGDHVSVRFSLPDGITVPQLYVYELNGTDLNRIACLKPTEDREYVLDDAHAGTFLLLQRSAEESAAMLNRRAAA